MHFSRRIMRVVNALLSFVFFSLLDLLDAVLWLVYKIVDYVVEEGWKLSSSSDNDNILVSEDGGCAKVLRLSSTKLYVDDISDTLYSRPTLVSRLSRVSTPARPATFKVASGMTFHPVPRWSDCGCNTCTLWASPSRSRDSLYVCSSGGECMHAGAAKESEDVLFIHGLVSSSVFWTETVFPSMSDAARSRYRLIAVDLLGFGRSPKPADSLYTLREHVEMVERSVLLPYKVKKFHIVAHSLGCIIALALAVKHPDSIKSLTLLAPPYFPVPKGEQVAQYVLRRVAPRRLWPVMALVASVGCWYKHISRTMCFLLCKNHRTWELLFKFVTRNRMRTFLIEGFLCHTHNSAWHTLHNIICGTAGRLEGYLDVVREKMTCGVTVVHGKDDDVLPVECSLAVGERVPRAKVKVVEGVDHITLVVGRQKAFATELEDIWNNTCN